MPRGIGGRIEDAFVDVKKKGEAAFVTFTTAGYPTKDGVYSLVYDPPDYSVNIIFRITHTKCFLRYTIHSHGNARGWSNSDRTWCALL